jgi:hypothetical protein
MGHSVPAGAWYDIRPFISTHIVDAEILNGGGDDGNFMMEDVGVDGCGCGRLWLWMAVMVGTCYQISSYKSSTSHVAISRVSQWNSFFSHAAAFPSGRRVPFRFVHISLDFLPYQRTSHHNFVHGHFWRPHRPGLYSSRRRSTPSYFRQSNHQLTRHQPCA